MYKILAFRWAMYSMGLSFCFPTVATIKAIPVLWDLQGMFYGIEQLYRHPRGDEVGSIHLSEGIDQYI